MTESILFWLAIPVGFLGIPVGPLEFILIPFGLVSIFNEFAAPREILINLFLAGSVFSLPPLCRACGKAWQFLDPHEDNWDHACKLGSIVGSSLAAIAILVGQGWIGGTNSSWLLNAYWFICLVQLWSCLFLVLSSRFARK